MRPVRDGLDEFFHEVVADRHVRTLYQLVAHCLYKEYIAEKAAMLLGDGQNDGHLRALRFGERLVAKGPDDQWRLVDEDAYGGMPDSFGKSETRGAVEFLNQ